MKKYAHIAKRGLEKIQNSDKNTKKKFLVISSTILTIFVIALWVVYLNITVPTIGTITTITETPATSTQNLVNNEPTQNTETSDKKESFLKTLERGTYIIFNDISSEIKKIISLGKIYVSDISHMLGPKNQIFIEGTSTQYLPQVTDPLPKNKLPKN